jgi:hypothetical protein
VLAPAGTASLYDIVVSIKLRPSSYVVLLVTIDNTTENVNAKGIAAAPESEVGHQIVASPDVTPMTASARGFSSASALRTRSASRNVSAPPEASAPPPSEVTTPPPPPPPPPPPLPGKMLQQFTANVTVRSASPLGSVYSVGWMAADGPAGMFRQIRTDFLDGNETSDYIRHCGQNASWHVESLVHLFHISVFGVGSTWLQLDHVHILTWLQLDHVHI